MCHFIVPRESTHLSALDSVFSQEELDSVTYDYISLKINEMAKEEAKCGVFRDFNIGFAEPWTTKEEAKEGPMSNSVNGKIRHN